MTVNEAISRVDALKPNMYQAEMKVSWLNQLEGMLYETVILTHEHGADLPGEFTPHDAETGLGDELLVPAPFTEIYRYWLESQIDYSNAEMAKYNASSAMYNMELEEYAAWYNRKHRPIDPVRAIRI